MKILNTDLTAAQVISFLEDIDAVCRKHGMVFYTEKFINEPEILWVDEAIFEPEDRLCVSSTGCDLRWEAIDTIPRDHIVSNVAA